MSKKKDPHLSPPPSLDMKQVREQARQLKSRHGWNPETFVSEAPIEAMRRLNQAQKNQQVYETSCEACQQARLKAQDETALCEVHLAEAMGF